MRRAFMFSAIFRLPVASGVSAAPQHNGSSTLSGVVLGPDDKPVAHATVSYQSSGGNGAHVVRTDSHGHFSITKLRADNYDLRASGQGVFPEWEQHATLPSCHTTSLPLYLLS